MGIRPLVAECLTPQLTTTTEYTEYTSKIKRHLVTFREVMFYWVALQGQEEVIKTSNQQ